MGISMGKMYNCDFYFSNISFIYCEILIAHRCAVTSEVIPRHTDFILVHYGLIYVMVNMRIAEKAQILYIFDKRLKQRITFSYDRFLKINEIRPDFDNRKKKLKVLFQIYG